MKPHSLRCKNREKFVRVKSEKVFYPGSIRTLSLFRQKNTLVFFFFFSKGSGKKTNKKRSSRYTQCKTPVRSLKKFIKTVIFNIIICKTKVTLISPGSFVKANARSLLFSGGELGEDAGFSIQSLTGI